MSLLLAFGLAGAPLDEQLFSQDPEVFCPGYTAAERTSYDASAALWPPGATECEYTTPNGEVRRSTYMPWPDYAFLALLVASVGLAFAAVRRAVSRRGLRVYAAAAVAFSVATVFLVGPWAAIVVPPLLVAMALAITVVTRVGWPGGVPGSGGT